MPVRPSTYHFHTRPRRPAARRLLALWVLLLALPIQSHAANFAGHWFQVEVIIFAYDGIGATPLRALPSARKLEIPKRYLTLRTRKHALGDGTRSYNGVPIGHSGRLEDDPFIALPASLRMLNGARSKLNQNGAYRILVHRAWRQPLFEHYRSLPMLIRAGNRIGERRELEGLLTLSVETYLAVEADLRLYSATMASSATRQDAPAMDPDAEDWHARAFDAEARYPELSGEQRFYEEAERGVHSVALRESRGRIRSGEIHYFDHPRLGMLVHFTRFAAP